MPDMPQDAKIMFFRDFHVIIDASIQVPEIIILDLVKIYCVLAFVLGQIRLCVDFGIYGKRGMRFSLHFSFSIQQNGKFTRT